MKKTRLIFLASIMASGALLSAMFFLLGTKPPMESTLSPAFQLFGKSTASMSRALTRIVPVNDIDEREFGVSISDKYASAESTGTKEHAYVNCVLKSVTAFARKPFRYRAYVIDNPHPNAFAMPGGVIFVTKKLLETLKSESELAAILAHETGHIELSHCLDAVRFELAAKKIGRATAGKLADLAVNLLLRHSYSKTQEDEADSYAYRLILETRYDPYGLPGAFASLSVSGGAPPERREADLIRDYANSHPPLALRIEKYGQKAGHWRKSHPLEKRYSGVNNLKELACFAEKSDYPGEWMTGGIKRPPGRSNQ
ncbi:MAG: M48 family metallopeptidase [Spirochaetes bacterium]|jgi:predicted Zn-dependent protease|nr:M48 family metallopeptidase [Spirochaetota bacterium]